MEPFEDQMQIEAICDGSFFCNGTFLCGGNNMDSIVDGPMTMRITMPLICDGSWLCDSSWSCGIYEEVL